MGFKSQWLRPRTEEMNETLTTNLRALRLSPHSHRMRRLLALTILCFVAALVLASSASAVTAATGTAHSDAAKGLTLLQGALRFTGQEATAAGSGLVDYKVLATLRYGTTTAYGESCQDTPAVDFPAPDQFTGFTDHPIVARCSIRDLLPTKTYHYRLEAQVTTIRKPTGFGGDTGETTTETLIGQDKTFTTPKPKVISLREALARDPDASAKLKNWANLSGNVNRSNRATKLKKVEVQAIKLGSQCQFIRPSGTRTMSCKQAKKTWRPATLKLNAAKSHGKWSVKLNGMRAGRYYIRVRVSEVSAKGRRSTSSLIIKLDARKPDDVRSKVTTK
jgi:hypothetical protein